MRRKWHVECTCQGLGVIIRGDQTGYGRIAEKICTFKAPNTRRKIRSKADRELFGVARVAQAASCCPMRSPDPRRSGSAAALVKSKCPTGGFYKSQPSLQPGPKRESDSQSCPRIFHQFQPPTGSAASSIRDWLRIHDRWFRGCATGGWLAVILDEGSK